MSVINFSDDDNESVFSTAIASAPYQLDTLRNNTTSTKGQMICKYQGVWHGVTKDDGVYTMNPECILNLPREATIIDTGLICVNTNRSKSIYIAYGRGLYIVLSSKSLSRLYCQGTIQQSTPFGIFNIWLNDKRVIINRGNSEIAMYSIDEFNRVLV